MVVKICMLFKFLLKKWSVWWKQETFFSETTFILPLLSLFSLFCFPPQFTKPFSLFHFLPLKSLHDLRYSLPPSFPVLVLPLNLRPTFGFIWNMGSLQNAIIYIHVRHMKLVPESALEAGWGPRRRSQIQISADRSLTWTWPFYPRGKETE